MKKTIYFLVFLLLIPNLALAIDSPGNLTATPLEESAIIEWDSVPTATQYEVCLSLPNIRHLRGLTPPVLDGILDTDVANYSQTGVIRPPNPVNTLDHDEIFAVVDNTTLYMGANTIDGDAVPNDDAIDVYFDFNDDGLTTDDVGYRLEEAGINKRFKWSGTSWIAFGGSGATFAVGGAGTTNVVYELFIPLSELPVDFTGNNTTLVVQRECEEVVDIYTYFPDSTAFSITDVTGWQKTFVSNYTSVDPITCFNESGTSYNLIGLDSFSAYEVNVSAFDGVDYSIPSHVEFITKDYPLYNASGYIIDSVSLEGIENVLVVATDTYTTGFSYTNETGYYNILNLHNDTYSINATKADHTANSTTITVAGSDVLVDTLLMTPNQYANSVSMNFIPMPLFLFILGIGIILTLYGFYFTDMDNYTHVLASFVSGILYILCGYNAYLGIGSYYGLSTEIKEAYYQSGHIGGLFVLFGILILVYSIVRILDIIKAEADEIDI